MALHLLSGWSDRLFKKYLHRKIKKFVELKYYYILQYILNLFHKCDMRFVEINYLTCKNVIYWYPSRKRKKSRQDSLSEHDKNVNLRVLNMKIWFSLNPNWCDGKSIGSQPKAFYRRIRPMNKYEAYRIS